MPDFLNTTQTQLRDNARQLAAELARLAEQADTPTQTGTPAQAGTSTQSGTPTQTGTSTQSGTALYAATMAASKSAGIWDLTQRLAPNSPASNSPAPNSPAPNSPAPNSPALDLVIVRDELGQHNVGHLPGIFAPTPGLLAQAEEPLRSSVLPKYLAGELRASFGFTEPADAVRPTWASRQGNELVINGQKSYVTGGADADFISTLVEIEDQGPAMVLIETDRPGVQLVRRFGSLDGSHHAAFTFADVRVPTTNVIGKPGKGMSGALSQIGGVRMALAAESVGLCGFVIELVQRHLSAQDLSAQDSASSGARAQDGARNSTRIKLGEMRTRAYACRSVVYRTARIVDAGTSDAGTSGAGKTGAGKNSVNEVMAAKAFATETIGELVDAAIQILGGQALIDTHPLSTILRRVRSYRLAEGPTDVLYGNIARGSLDLELGRI